MQNKASEYRNILKESAPKIVLALCKFENPDAQALKHVIHNLMDNVSPNSEIDVLQATRNAINAYMNFHELVEGLNLSDLDGETPKGEGYLSAVHTCEFVETVLKETGTRDRLMDLHALDQKNADINDPMVTGPLTVVHDLLSQVYNTMLGIFFTFN